MIRSFNRPCSRDTKNRSNMYETLGLILAPVIFLGCMIYPCRPMGVGVRFFEDEVLSNTLYNGLYRKDCVYTKVFQDGNYSYECGYERVNPL